MKTYLKLVSFEFERFSKFFAVLLGLTISSQLIGVIFESRRYVSIANDMLYVERMTLQDVFTERGPMTMLRVADTMWVTGPIALCAIALLFYSFFIWYREWFGRTTFAYRLLMLPVPRIQIYLSKLTVIFLAVLSLVTVQLGILWIGNLLTGALVPSEYFVSMDVMTIARQHPLLEVLIPPSFTQLVLRYGAGLLWLIALFTCILLERSFRGIGIAAAIAYSSIVFLLLFSPIFIQSLMGSSFLYLSEIVLLTTGLGIASAAASLFFSSYLLNKKVTV